MKNQYQILSKETLAKFFFKESSSSIVSVEPDLLFDMTFSPKIFIINDISKKIESFVQYGVEWLTARVDCSPSQPEYDQIKVYENFRMPYIHQTYRLTVESKQFGKLNWLDLNKVELDFSCLVDVPLEERLLFKLEEDFGYVFIHNSIIEALNPLVRDVWFRDV